MELQHRSHQHDHLPQVPRRTIGTPESKPTNTRWKTAQLRRASFALRKWPWPHFELPTTASRGGAARYGHVTRQWHCHPCHLLTVFEDPPVILRYYMLGLGLLYGWFLAVGAWWSQICPKCSSHIRQCIPHPRLLLEQSGALSKGLEQVSRNITLNIWSLIMVDKASYIVW